MPRLGIAAVSLVLLLAAGPAIAHALKVFAFVEGTTIRGSVYFAGGARVRAAAVVAMGPAGEILAETRTAADGSFVLDARERVDHRIIADSGDGHRAEFVVRAAELPSMLPARGADGALREGPIAVASAPQAAAAPAPSPAEIEAMIDRAVGRHMAAIAARLAAMEDTVRWRDVLGGLGYILGLTGVALFVVARGRRRGGGG